MIRAVRETEKALGNGKKKPTVEEEDIKKVARRSIVARVDIPKETIITEEMLAIKRPGTGIEPRYLDKVVGSVAKTVMKRDEVITWKKLGDETIDKAN
jgi:N-acetylneuraminate synthase/N,N'-diacetyllegionaminate synthase